MAPLTSSFDAIVFGNGQNERGLRGRCMCGPQPSPNVSCSPRAVPA